MTPTTLHSFQRPPEWSAYCGQISLDGVAFFIRLVDDIRRVTCEAAGGEPECWIV